MAIREEIRLKLIQSLIKRTNAHYRANLELLGL